MLVGIQTVGLLVFRRLVGWFGLGPDRDAKDVELAVLRHQLAALRRQVARPRYRPADRLVLAWLASLLPRERWSVFLVTPATLLRWHRELAARCWTYRTPATDVVSTRTSSSSWCGWRGRTRARHTRGSFAKPAGSTSWCPRPRCDGSCACTGTLLLRVAAGARAG